MVEMYQKNIIVVYSIRQMYFNCPRKISTKLLIDTTRRPEPTERKSIFITL